MEEGGDIEPTEADSMTEENGTSPRQPQQTQDEQTTETPQEVQTEATEVSV